MGKHYLNVNYDGTIFEWSKDSAEGFVKHTNSAGKESYRKYYNKGVEGKLVCINKKTNPNLHNREEIEIVLNGQGDESYNLTFVVYGQDNFLDTYTEHLVKYLPKLEKSVTYNINNWFIKKGDTINGSVAERNAKGITVKVDGVKIEPALTYKSDENPNGDIPALVWKEKGDKKVPSAASKEERSDYLYNILQTEAERLKWSQGEQQPSTSTPQPKAETPKNAVPTASPQEAFAPATNYVPDNPKIDQLPF